MSPASTVCIALTLALLDAATANAGGSHVYTATDAVWKEECGACHIAYPPQLLSAAGWRGLMSGLGRHFGADASLDAQTSRHIAAFLERNAGSDARSGGPVARITETRWFVSEHDELPAGVWKRPEVRSAANCAACHTQAEAGDFSKRTRRVPR